MLSILEALAEERSPELRLATVRLDEVPELARRFEVIALPKMLPFVDGRPTARITGARGQQELLGDLDELLTR